LTNTDT